jgi:hypothetical protein
VKSCIALKLDAGVAVEALLLERLTELPEARREEWLRSLMLKGLQKECRELQKLNCRSLPGAEAISPQAADESRSTDRRASAASTPAAPTTSPRASDALQSPVTIVSLAALREMIGQDSRVRAAADPPSAQNTAMEIAP